MEHQSDSLYKSDILSRSLAHFSSTKIFHIITYHDNSTRWSQHNHYGETLGRTMGNKCISCKFISVGSVVFFRHQLVTMRVLHVELIISFDRKQAAQSWNHYCFSSQKISSLLMQSVLICNSGPYQPCVSMLLGVDFTYNLILGLSSAHFQLGKFGNIFSMEMLLFEIYHRELILGTPV